MNTFGLALTIQKDMMSFRKHSMPLSGKLFVDKKTVKKKTHTAALTQPTKQSSFHQTAAWTTTTSLTSNTAS